MRTADPPESFRFSTGAVQTGETLSAYRELFSGMLASFRIAPLSGDFLCNARFRRLPDLSILTVAGSPVRASWQHVMTPNSDRGIALMLLGSHAAVVGQGGR